MLLKESRRKTCLSKLWPNDPNSRFTQSATKKNLTKLCRKIYKTSNLKDGRSVTRNQLSVFYFSHIFKLRMEKLFSWFNFTPTATSLRLNLVNSLKLSQLLFRSWEFSHVCTSFLSLTLIMNAEAVHHRWRRELFKGLRHLLMLSDTTHHEKKTNKWN